MSYLSPIGASTPVSPLPPEDVAGSADDTNVGGDDDFVPPYHGKEPPYCPGEDPNPPPGQHPHARPHPGGLLHPSVAGTQVGSEG